MKNIALALLFSMSAIFNAYADEVAHPAVEITLVQSAGTNMWSADFGNTINKPSEVEFVDTYMFSPQMAGDYSVNGGVFNFFWNQPQSIVFRSVTVNDVELKLTSTYDAKTKLSTHTASLGPTTFKGPLKLEVHGFAGGEALPSASYAGTLNVIGVAAVPEPETYAMLVAGLGLVGLMARRRKQSV